MISTPASTLARGPRVRAAGEVLAAAQQARIAAEAAEVRLLVEAVEWAVMNPPTLGRDAARWEHRTSGSAAPVREPLSADGVPEVDRGAIAELGLAIGWSTQAAQALVGDGLELAFRLPTLWTRVRAGEVKPWRARHVAQGTRRLSRLAAGFVDRQIAAVAHRVTGPQVDRLVATAIARFDPSAAAIADADRDRRGFGVHLDETTLGGLTPVTGLIDLPDALDLETAVAHAATERAAWGSDDALDIRRARALGDLARQHLAWHDREVPSEGGLVTIETGDGGAAASITVADRDGAAVDPREVGDEQSPRFRVPPRRQVVLYVHLTDAVWRALTDHSLDHSPDRPGTREGGPGSGLLGRVENTDCPVTARTIREWCGDARTAVSIRPVLDLAGYQRAGGYEIPARLREQVRLRDGTCVFPGCHAPGLRCQDDHIDSYDHDHPDQGGSTDSDNLALLCQRHHTLKTHHGFRYAVLPSGTVQWRTPHGLTVDRRPDGTLTATCPGPAHTSADADADPPDT